MEIIMGKRDYEYAGKRKKSAESRKGNKTQK